MKTRTFYVVHADNILLTEDGMLYSGVAECGSIEEAEAVVQGGANRGRGYTIVQVTETRKPIAYIIRGWEDDRIHYIYTEGEYRNAYHRNNMFAVIVRFGEEGLMLTHAHTRNV